MYTTLTQDIKDQASAKLANYMAANISELLTQFYVDLNLENEDPAQAKKLVDDLLDAIADGSVTPQKSVTNNGAYLADGENEEPPLKPINPSAYDWLTDNATTKEFYAYRDKKVYEYKTNGRIPLESMTN